MKHAIAIGLAALPALALAYRFATQGWGAEPVEAISHVTGEWGLRFIFCSLAITPIRHYFGVKGIAPLRRTLGLAGFTYAVAHMLSWAVLELELDPNAILEDLTERPFVMAGMAAFSILVALAATSTRASMRRLGPRWVQLHRLVYVAAALGVIHHFWLIKADYRPAIVHATLLAVLLGSRALWKARQPRQPATEG